MILQKLVGYYTTIIITTNLLKYLLTMPEMELTIYEEKKITSKMKVNIYECHKKIVLESCIML